jgi:hypothetical protein
MMQCPKCGSECERDEVDNGVGMQAVGPWGCPECYWVEPDPAAELLELLTPPSQET